MLNVLLTLPLALAPIAPAPTALLVTQDADTVESLLDQGRAELENGRPIQAEEFFQKADQLSGEKLETKMWVLRAWMDQGRSNDTLDAIDKLTKAGNKGLEIDYLYGMAFERRAEQAMMNGSGDISVQMNFDDAVRFLQKVTEADPNRYRDAFLPLATAGWHAQKLDIARKAAEEAVLRYPKHGEANLMLGRICLSQFQVAHGSAEQPPVEEWPDEVTGHWTLARDAFADAMTNFGSPKRNDTRTQNLLSQAAVQLGHTWVWKSAREEASQAYATAIGWMPDRVNIAEIRGLVTNPDNPNDLSLFCDTLEGAVTKFQKTFGKKDARNGALLWWLGYARYWGGKRVEAEAAFVDCLAIEPGYTNSWVYIGLSRYDQKKWPEAIEAFHTSWKADPTTTINEVRADLNGNAAKLKFLLGQAYKDNNLEQCAMLAELVAESTTNVAADWNNAGLFLRDWAEFQARTKKNLTADERAGIMKLYENSLRAYTRSMDLSPEDPQVLNDTAVILHYYLQREFERAESMYVKAGELADKLLADGKLKGEELNRIQIAKRDAGNNLRLLRKAMKDAKKPVEAGTGKQ